MTTNGGTLAPLVVAFALAGCSSLPNAVNPVAWYRDLSGASKNDALDKDAANQKNLDAGGKQPYPNLASVPEAPSNATSGIDRDALQKGLIADRSNATYSDEQLRAGFPSSAAALPPPPQTSSLPVPRVAAVSGAVQQQAAAQPSESPLTSPSVRAVPQGEAPVPPPPPPAMGTNQQIDKPQQTAALPSGRRRTASASDEVASVTFATGATTLSEEERSRLSEVAALQHTKGGTLRVVGHAAEAGDAAAQQKLDNFALALARAKAVAQVLSGEGVPPQAIAVEAAPAGTGAAAAGTTEIFLEH